ncbi:hypothetical protein M0L22_RS16325 [Providencia rettgeri]|uniref:hypothetical protein n=2 Tax=Morganellaceae TaxID=1903414 RepID=UPI000EEE3579|nr:hypothetical protein [Providencia sp. PROV039]EJD6614921.1 hypothetical protein [Providencia rettgeri]HCI97538.1 hypothetical protein [Providencia sp.]ELL9150606.1 hypothetical protein [Providencia rettgeri]ELR5059196.1 hypothetical protein [Providencia rettgeri]ELR5088640.1 hypothetical protein [Providencia rettgeri]
MPNINNTHLLHANTDYIITLAQADTDDGIKNFFIDNHTNTAYQLVSLKNREIQFHQTAPSILDILKKNGSLLANRMVHVNLSELIQGINLTGNSSLTTNPNFTKLILSQYNTVITQPNRFKAISELSQVEKNQYQQLTRSTDTAQLRAALLSLIDDEVKGELNIMAKEWGMYGVSACEVDKKSYALFKEFYDEKMKEHAVCKDDYKKLDFATQNIKTAITDPRCLNAKLTPLQIFKAAYQLGDIPAVSNFRFMFNPASKDDGKYREWMYHFDNSNYAAEFKLITTRTANSLEANTEQCLAAFPYDTESTIRFTKNEAATKFPTMDNLQHEFSHVPGAHYTVIRNPNNTTPIETGIRTEMIVHHRSASGQNETQSRDAELMTFHGTERCQPFLSIQELASAPHLTSLQRFVLGGFIDTDPNEFIDKLREEKETLNAQVKQSIQHQHFVPLDNITVAKFSEQGIQVTNQSLFNKQVSTYDNLPEVLDKIPKLKLDHPLTEQQKTVLAIVPLLMNYDQNAELKPDCSENKAFPARTQLRERTKEAFTKPLLRDLPNITFHDPADHLIANQHIIQLAKDIQQFYQDVVQSLTISNTEPKQIALYESRAALAEEYIGQFDKRATYPETHQVLALFTYYMIEDLKSDSELQRNNQALFHKIEAQQRPLLQHFASHRLLNDMLSDG